MRALPLCLAAVLGMLSACEDNALPGVDGGVGRLLQILTPPGSQIGLRYGRSVDLRVRYVRDDADSTPIADAPVHWALFDDPVGSTLTRDEVQTDEAGNATVTLTAGMQEGSFHVRASADSAADAELVVAVSELEFVQLDTTLSDPLPAPGGRTLTAALFQGKTCGELPPAAKLTGADRTLSGGAAATSTLSFVFLLSRQYSVVGRVETAGRLLAYGCLDVDRALVPPGAHLFLPLVMRAVQPSIVGGFDLDTDAGSARATRDDGLFADVDVLDRCAGHLGQLLLDELSTRVPPMRAAQIAALRGPLADNTVGSSTVQCRPAMAGASMSLDAELGALVAAAGSPGEQRVALLADLDAVLEGVRLRSHLDITPVTPLLTDGPSAPRRYAVAHRGAVVTITAGGAMRVDDLAQLGVPVLGATGISARDSNDSLVLDAHSLPIGLPALWGDALDVLGVEARLPALADKTFGGWVEASALAASRNAKSGCAAIEDLVCERTNPAGCAGTLTAPCTAAVAAVVTRLTAPFADTTPLTLQGTATVLDDDGDLVGDRLSPGQWAASGAIDGQLFFTGTRSAP